MLGIIYSILAGILISIQGVFNTRVSDKIGLWETTTIVHAIGLAFAFIIMLIWGDGNFKKLEAVNKIYLLGGAFGVIVIYSVIKGISLLGVTFSVEILLITQLICATIIDNFGLFGNPQVKVDFTKLLGILVMIGGIIIFKLKG